jgi:hypothetical protein
MPEQGSSGVGAAACRITLFLAGAGADTTGAGFSISTSGSLGSVANVESDRMMPLVPSNRASWRTPSSLRVRVKFRSAAEEIALIATPMQRALVPQRCTEAR